MEVQKDVATSSGIFMIYNNEQLAVEVPETAHKISSGTILFNFSGFIWYINLSLFPLNTIHLFFVHADSWFQAGFVLTTGINSAYVLGYSGAVMVPLGWVGGVVGLILATLISLYANILIAKLHEFGGKRHIRYRDLAGFVYGNQLITKHHNTDFTSCKLYILHNRAHENDPLQVRKLIFLHGHCNMWIFSW